MKTPVGRKALVNYLKEHYPGVRFASGHNLVINGFEKAYARRVHSVPRINCYFRRKNYTLYVQNNASDENVYTGTTPEEVLNKSPFHKIYTRLSATNRFIFTSYLYEIGNKLKEMGMKVGYDENRRDNMLMYSIGLPVRPCFNMNLKDGTLGFELRTQRENDLFTVKIADPECNNKILSLMTNVMDLSKSIKVMCESPDSS